MALRSVSLEGMCAGGMGPSALLGLLSSPTDPAEAGPDPRPHFLEGDTNLSPFLVIVDPRLTVGSGFITLDAGALPAALTTSSWAGGSQSDPRTETGKELFSPCLMGTATPTGCSRDWKPIEPGSAQV
ncbi:hypothetical protein KIL84_005002 [Mauremys mutica]|uniref:Uncharacterized protein n=1 Tax=Mauremys mutica TaxID=74926 RepID=A0A9D4B5F6_9SAUR|nr:hypothetical protein KIL84_005002 [Mauremys mutica]